jgi:4-alpha-glucanotransferase
MPAAALPTLADRAAGVLLHLTSLPGPHGCGDLGAEAYAFADFLAGAGVRWWQMLPVGPAGYGDSPYQAHSSFAGDPLLLDPDALGGGRTLPASARADFEGARVVREHALRESPAPPRALAAFRRRHADWLPDWTLYAAIKAEHDGAAWSEWPAPLRDRKPAALAAARARLAGEIAHHEKAQWAFDEQWRALRAHCAARGVALLGDVPIFVAHDSADVWANRQLFHLDAAGRPTVVAGVPPDYFSATGQRWGNPLYRWPAHRRHRFAWWIRRMRAALARFDAVRLDHFIGFTRYWEIPAGEETATRGRWRPGPGAALLDALRRGLGGKLPLVAEDLGAVTPAVKALRDRFSLPGLRVLQFAFGDDPSAPDFVPHAYPRATVAYTGTHDNNTTAGWHADEATPAERAAFAAYLGGEPREPHWDMIRLVMMSVANLAVMPAQDLLGLPASSRMNRPGIAAGNWRWRLAPGTPGPREQARLAELVRIYGRSPT